MKAITDNRGTTSIETIAPINALRPQLERHSLPSLFPPKAGNMFRLTGQGRTCIAVFAVGSGVIDAGRQLLVPVRTPLCFQALNLGMWNIVYQI